jgi:hypothetical protein
VNRSPVPSSVRPAPTSVVPAPLARLLAIPGPGPGPVLHTGAPHTGAPRTGVPRGQVQRARPFPVPFPAVQGPAAPRGAPFRGRVLYAVDPSNRRFEK